MSGAPAPQRRPAPGLLALVLLGAAALGVGEGLFGLLEVGPAAAPRATTLLLYAAVTWLLPAAACVLPVLLLTAVLQRLSGRPVTARAGLAAGLGLFAAVVLGLDGRGPAVACLGALLVTPAALLVLGWLARRRPARLALAVALVLAAVVAGAGAWLQARVALPERGPAPGEVLAEHAPGGGRGAGGVSDEGARPGPPGLVVLLADALRADALSAYGGATPTPHIDALGERGWVVPDVLSTSSWTLPSVSSLFSARTPREHGVVDYDGALPADVPHLAAHAAAHGFRTAAVVGNPLVDRARGFLRGFQIVRADTHAVPASLFWVVRGNRLAVAQGWISGPNAARKLAVPWWKPGHGLLVRRTGYLAADEATDAALALLPALAGRPFVLYVHYFDPHDPYREHPAPLGEHEPEFEPQRRAELAARYAGEVAFLDAQVGRLLAGLREAGLLQRSVVLFTADHGEEFLDHGGFRHGASLHDELVRVPLLVRFPDGVLPPPAPRAASLLDVAPTLLDAVGLPPLPGAAGGSLLARAGQDGMARPRFTERIQQECWLVALRQHGLHWIARLPPELAPPRDELLHWAEALSAPPAPLARWDLDDDQPFVVPAARQALVRVVDGAGRDGSRALSFAGPASVRSPSLTVVRDGVLGARLLAGRVETQDGEAEHGAGAERARGANRTADTAHTGEAEPGSDAGPPAPLRATFEVRAPGGEWVADWGAAVQAPEDTGALVPVLLRPRRVTAGDEVRLVVQVPPGPAPRGWAHVVDEVEVALDDPRLLFELQVLQLRDGGPPVPWSGAALEHPGAREALASLLRHAASGRPATARPLAPDERQRLEAMGYLR